MQRITQHQLLLKYISEDKQVDTDMALLRAAAAGAADDVNLLLDFEACITVRDSAGRTPLHHAVLSGCEETMKVLLKRGASLYAVDVENQSVADYAWNSEHQSIRAYGKNLPIIMSDRNLLSCLIKHLDLHDLHALGEASILLAVKIAIHENNIFSTISPTAKTKLTSMNMPLRLTIIKRLNDPNQLEKLKLLFDILSMESGKRFAELEARLKIKLPENMSVTESAVTAIVLGILKPEQIDTLNSLSDLRRQYAVQMIDEGLCTLEQLHLIHNHNSSYKICCTKGMSALRKKLLLIEDINKIDDFEELFSKQNIDLLASGFINSKMLVAISGVMYNFKLQPLIDLCNSYKDQKNALLLSDFDSSTEVDVSSAIAIYKNIALYTSPFIKTILTENLLTIREIVNLGLSSASLCEHLLSMLRNKLIPIDKLPTMPCLNALLSPKGIQALTAGLINWRQANSFDNDQMTDLLTNGMTLLHDGVITVAEAKQIVTKKSNLKALASEQVKQALNAGIITIKDAESKSLRCLLLENAILVLNEKLMTLDEMIAIYEHPGSNYTSHALEALLKPLGLQALRERLITPDDAMKFHYYGNTYYNNDNLEQLLNQVGLHALRKKLITPEQAANTYNLQRWLCVDNPEIITALKIGAVTPEDFRQNCKHYETYNMSRSEKTKSQITNELIVAHVVATNKKNQQSATCIQSAWRGYYARSRYLLFQETARFLSSGKVSMINVHVLSDTVKLLENGRVHEAKKHYKALKK